MTLNRPTCRICGNAECDHLFTEHTYGKEFALETKVAHLTKVIFEMNDKINTLELNRKAEFTFILNKLLEFEERIEGKAPSPSPLPTS